MWLDCASALVLQCATVALLAAALRGAEACVLQHFPS
uniref:Uncharacterized protein n=1 Tax=Anguilla anguilla TaxID=7936 RepID=A0A0E9R7E0_ANGAN